MATSCVIKDSEYRTKLALSGIPESIFLALAKLFLDNFGRFPNLDEIPNADSSEYLKEEMHIKKDNSVKILDVLNSTGTNSITEAIVKVNDTYTDLEVDIFPLNLEAIVDIKNRPSEYRIGEYIEHNIDMNPNSAVIFNLMFDKLRNLYGILLIPITDHELATELWLNIPDAKNVKAFVHEGNIYINTDLADVDAPIHEMTHILLGSIRFKNPELYFLLVSMSELFPEYITMSSKYTNKTRDDLNEEIFVLEVSKYLSGLPSVLDLIDSKIKYELHYNIKRLLDSVLMGLYSVKSFLNSLLYQMSLKQLAITTESMLINPVNLGSLDDASKHRILANKKSDLMKKGDLKEECL